MNVEINRDSFLFDNKHLVISCFPYFIGTPLCIWGGGLGMCKNIKYIIFFERLQKEHVLFRNCDNCITAADPRNTVKKT